MNTIKFNNAEFEVESYSKTTYFNNALSSNASCSIITNDIDTLNALAIEPITSLQILHEGEVIYNLHDINAKIDSINEYLNGNRMNINVSLNFLFE